MIIGSDCISKFAYECSQAVTNTTKSYKCYSWWYDMFLKQFFNYGHFRIINISDLKIKILIGYENRSNKYTFNTLFQSMHAIDTMYCYVQFDLLLFIVKSLDIKIQVNYKYFSQYCGLYNNQILFLFTF